MPAPPCVSASLGRVSSKKTIALIAGGILLVAAVFLIVIYLAGTPKNAQPPVYEAPSTN